MLEKGKSAKATTIVSINNTAKTVGSGSLDVFSTPMMIALMEKAACECLSDSLEEGQTSVGTKISVEHKAASPLGAEITATATIDEIDGRSINYSITTSDGSTEIGSGKHTRVIINAERFMSKL
ncbi:MAG: thioesterase family protein [Defluviitaleaceae bacterium]|nr:thioesterase family protein [Defluviitaleaceae bacterium]